MSLPAKATTPPFNPDSRVPAGVVVESLALDGSALLWQEWHAICWQETHFSPHPCTLQITNIKKGYLLMVLGMGLSIIGVS